MRRVDQQGNLGTARVFEDVGTVDELVGAGRRLGVRVLSLPVSFFAHSVERLNRGLIHPICGVGTFPSAPPREFLASVLPVIGG